jgi:hypothetical protein
MIVGTPKVGVIRVGKPGVGRPGGGTNNSGTGTAPPVGTFPDNTTSANEYLIFFV